MFASEGGPVVRARTPRRRWMLVVAAALVCGLPACGGSSGPYVWYRDLPKEEFGERTGEYVIGVGDGIRVQVYENEGLSTVGKIRSDGRIALPFVGEIVAVGKHPSGLARELEARLREFIVNPRVTVNVDSSQPITVNVLGEAGHVGSLTLEAPAGLLDVIARAGGFSDYADKSSIYVLRRSPEFRRIRFTYDALLQNQSGAAAFTLRTGDVIVVE